MHSMNNDFMYITCNIFFVGEYRERKLQSISAFLKSNPEASTFDYISRINRGNNTEYSVFWFWFKQYLFIKYTIYTNTMVDMQDWA